jgi:hypothetical protein
MFEDDSPTDIEGGDYKIYSSKLVKFRDTKLTPIRFLQSGSRGKMLITFD